MAGDEHDEPVRLRDALLWSGVALVVVLALWSILLAYLP